MILLRPVGKAFRITQRFGENPALYPATKGHMGLDFGVPVGTRVIAAAGGRVTQCGLDGETANNPLAGYGIHARISSAEGLMIYGHLSGCGVSVGQAVQAGEYVGDSGNTGRSTAPHLHFEVRTGINQVNAIDPEPYLVDALPNVLFSATVTAEGDRLNVRTRPSTAGNTPARVLRTGERVEVIGFAADSVGRVWFRISDGMYVVFNAAWVELRGG